MNSLRNHSEAGFSIIEMLIVLAILGVVVTFAILALGKAPENIRRQAVAKEFKVALERSRFDSVKRRPAACAQMSRVELLSATSFRYITDLDQNGTLDPDSESRLVDFTQSSNVEMIEDSGTTYPIVIRFNQRGETSSGACGSETTAHTPTVFCQLPCSTPDSSNSSKVYVSPTGTVALLDGGESIPTFTAPSVSNVATNFGINDSLAVWTGTPPTPTPYGSVDPSPSVSVDPSVSPSVDPSVDPSVSPSVDPSVSPSVDPSVSPTVEPTATPLPDCGNNERPGVPAACYCAPPRFVQGNGMCK